MCAGARRIGHQAQCFNSAHAQAKVGARVTCRERERAERGHKVGVCRDTALTRANRRGQRTGRLHTRGKRRPVLELCQPHGCFAFRAMLDAHFG